MDSPPAGDTLSPMRSFGDMIDRPRPMTQAAAMAALFPEFRDGAFAEGLLRAPPFGRRPSPCLSALVRELPGTGSVLEDRAWEAPALLARAATARRALVAARVGGHWWHGGEPREMPPGTGLAFVAVADADGDMPPDPLVAAAMLHRALAENPAGRVVVLMPEAIGRPLRTTVEAAVRHGAAVVGRPVDPWIVLDRAARIYSAGGELGFLGLVAGIPVTAFGNGCYTGWGATEDAPGVRQHACRRSENEIFAGVCLVATRYRDPFRNVATSFEDALAILADWRRVDEANRGIAVCVGMSFWKRRRIADFVRSSAGVPVFRRSVAGALAAARSGPHAPRAIAGWASRLPSGLAEAASRQRIPLIRVEDGFIRSVGLGSDFLPPASLIYDSRGMYFDPHGPSDLEMLLREAEFGPALVARAAHLTAQLVARGITKYNLVGSGRRLDMPSGRRLILVPGQVEDDLSIRLGGGTIRTNIELLAEVRAANPEAFILYKPHPDVVAGHRAGAVPEAKVRQFADVIVRDVATAALLSRVDELHTMTSLAGFEALLRQRRVAVYGRPFYAGWGLTVDRLPFDRGRQLTLAELVAGTLILYPRYLDPLTRLPCGPEVIIERLDDPELWRPGPLVLARRWQGALARRLGEVRARLSSIGSSPASGLGERPRP